jgi:hypothetical protein
VTQEKIVLLGQSAAELIELFRSESALGSQIREYFTSYCDCDIAEWLIAQLTAHNQEVVDRVNELLAASTMGLKGVQKLVNIVLMLHPLLMTIWRISH